MVGTLLEFLLLLPIVVALLLPEHRRTPFLPVLQSQPLHLDMYPSLHKITNVRISIQN
jgi:hypothetical protein